MTDKKYVTGGVHSLNGDTIQVLPLNHTNDFFVSLVVSQVRVTLNGANIVRISTSVDVFLQFGNSGVAAVANTTGNTYHPQGVEVFAVPEGATHVSMVKAAGVLDGFGTVTQMGD